MTRSLIDSLVADLSPTPARPRVAAARVMLVAFAAMTLLAWWILGNRLINDWPSLTAISWCKLLPFAVAAVGLSIVVRDCARPGSVAPRWTMAVVMLGWLAIAGFVVVGLISQGATSIQMSMSRRCVISIPLLALPAILLFCRELRRGAVTRPVRAGACAGAAAGMCAAVAYGMSCYMDQLAFVGIWYTTGIAIAMGMGAMIGGRLLRW